MIAESEIVFSTKSHILVLHILDRRGNLFEHNRSSMLELQIIKCSRLPVGTDISGPIVVHGFNEGYLLSTEKSRSQMSFPRPYNPRGYNFEDADESSYLEFISPQ